MHSEHRTDIARRKWVAAAAGMLVSSAFPTASIAQSTTSASLRFHWTWLGGMAPMFYGVRNGFFKDAGIDLSLGEGRGSGTTVKMVAAGDDTFAWADTGAVVLAAAKGVPVKQIMTFATNTLCCVWIDGRTSIRSGKDLIGKRIGTAAGDGNDQLFPAVLAVNGVRPEQVQKIILDPATKVAALAQGRIDVILGGTPGEPVALRLAGFPAKTMLYSELGVPTLGQGISVSKKLLEEKPDLVRRFVAATKRSWIETMKNPRAALDAMVDRTDMQDRRPYLEMGYAALSQVLIRQQDFGFTPPTAMSETVSLLEKYSNLPTQKRAEDFYTNAFV
jgi:NitT/TauT family transport system substrate-binding protein